MLQTQFFLSIPISAWAKAKTNAVIPDPKRCQGIYHRDKVQGNDFVLGGMDFGCLPRRHEGSIGGRERSCGVFSSGRALKVAVFLWKRLRQTAKARGKGAREREALTRRVLCRS